MFQIRVHQRRAPSPPLSALAEEAKEENDELMDAAGVYGTAEELALEQAGGTSFLTGNPQVQISTGKLRFYRPDRPYPDWTPATAAVHALGGGDGELQPGGDADGNSHGNDHDVNGNRNGTGEGTNVGHGHGLPPTGLPSERNTLLCIVTVPSHMSPVELLDFLSGFREDIELVRILKDPSRTNCMALLQFSTQDRADRFFLAHNGTYFNSIELERCKIVFVRSIEFDTLPFSEPEPSPPDMEQKQSDARHGADEAVVTTPDTTTAEALVTTSEAMEPSVTGSAMADHERKLLLLPPPPGMTEIPTCAVCLDRLDASASGILTTLCNHTFHCDCLFRWEGSSCPVCRYSHGDIGSACEVCQTTEHLWICLICGHVGCGRYSNEHAKQHYQETMHTYSLELETQRVWDYAGDGFVHRLILNKHDGKFVEFPSPSAVSGERSQLPPPTTAELEEGEHRKLEKLAVEYNFLLKSQLEEQRLYYERKLASSNESEQRHRINALEQDKRSLQRVNTGLNEKARKLEEELTFVRELNKSLIENQKQWKERVRVLEEEKTQRGGVSADRVADLEAQVRDLMFYLDTQSKVEQSSHREDIQGGTVQVEERPARANTNASTSSSSSTSQQRRARRRK